MSLHKELVLALPELAEKENEFLHGGTISLCDDSDGQGAYIEKWEYAKPLPKGFKVGK
jgi:hypothetical protein